MRDDRCLADLRSLLRDGVEASRRARVAAQPRAGVFTRFEDERVVHFTTMGRRTGRAHTKWWLPFAPDGDVLYLLEENATSAHWVQNVLADPQVALEDLEVIARIVADPAEQARARQLCAARFERVGLVVADLVERGLLVAFEPRA